MKLNYIDSLFVVKKIFFNGIFLKYFFNVNLFYNFFIYYNSFYRICKSVQKSRSFVNFSTKKIYNQKGTGKARAGSLSSPTRIKGSKAFPNLYFLNYKKFFNKFSYKIIYFIVYSNIFLNNYFFIVEDYFFLEIKSKLILFFLNFKFLKKYVFLTIKINKNFFLSLNNFKSFRLLYFFNFNPIILLKFFKIFITRSCIENFFND